MLAFEPECGASLLKDGAYGKVDGDKDRHHPVRLECFLGEAEQGLVWQHQREEDEEKKSDRGDIAEGERHA